MNLKEARCFVAAYMAYINTRRNIESLGLHMHKALMDVSPADITNDATNKSRLGNDKG